MDDGTESFKTYDPESYEWDYEEPRDRPPRVFWGRIVALILLLAGAFWLGRSSAPEVDITSEIEAANKQLDQAQNEIENLEAQLADRPAATAEATPEPSTTAASGEEQIYIVKSGDSLAAIALEFYGDSSLADLIADANDIKNAESIRPGDELIIPPEP